MAHTHNSQLRNSTTTNEGLFISDVILETLIICTLLDVSIWCLSLMNRRRFRVSLNTLATSVGSASSVVISQQEVKAVFRRNSVKIALAVTPVVFSVCCAFYVTYGRVSNRYRSIMYGKQ